MRQAVLVLLCCLAVAHTLCLQRAAVAMPRLRRGRPVSLSSANSDDRDENTKAEDDALAKAFAARLEQEGGATQFKIKSSISGAKDELKQGAANIAGSARDVASVGGDGLLKADAWQLIVGLLVATVVFSCVNAAARSGDKVDRFTSDGSTLEFGQRAPAREGSYSAYQPQYGVGQ